MEDDRLYGLSTLIESVIKTIQKIKDSLSSWAGDQRIDDFLKALFKEYNKMLFELNVNCEYDFLSPKQLQTIELIERRIVQSLKDYYNGHLYGAIGEIDFLLQDINLINGFNISTLHENDIWYRGRIKEEGMRLYERKEMFHIPNHMREKVNNQRFSLNGYPCLYLGKSIWACWEELNEPHLDDICFSALKITKEIKVLDLSIPINEMIENKTSDELLTLLITMPLSIACSVKTLNEKANFKSEYVIPQLLMANLINSEYFEGFVFTSTKRNPALEWSESYLQNVVLPIEGDFDDDGLCVNLKERFCITDSICYKYEFLKSSISNMIPASSKEVEAALDGVFCGKKHKEKDEDMYPRALFGQMEDLLKKKEFLQIN